MALQESGPISLQDIHAEFGGPTPIVLSNYYRGGSYVPDSSLNTTIPTSGVISIQDFYGASNDKLVSQHSMEFIRGSDDRWFGGSFSGGRKYEGVLTQGFNYQPTSFSCSAWVYPYSFNGQQIFTKDAVWGANFDRSFQFRLDSDGALTLILFDDIDIYSTSSQVPTNQWSQVIAIYDHGQGEVRLYINGELENTFTHTASTNWKSDWPLSIGTRYSEENDESLYYDEWFDGKIFDPRLYGKVLSQTEIDYLQTEYPPVDGLIGHWPFNSSDGEDVFDATNNNNHGSLVNDPEYDSDTPF